MKLEHLVHQDTIRSEPASNQGANGRVEHSRRDSRRRPRPLDLNHLTNSSESNPDHLRTLSLASAPPIGPSQEMRLPSIHTLVNASQASPPIISPQGTSFLQPTLSHHQTQGRRSTLSSPSLQVVHPSRLPASPPQPLPTYPKAYAPGNSHVPSDGAIVHRHQIRDGFLVPTPIPPAEIVRAYDPPTTDLPFSPPALNSPDPFNYISLSAAARPRSISHGGYPEIRQSMTATPLRTISFDASPELLQASVRSKWQHHHYISPSAHAGYGNQLTERYTCPTCSRPFSRPSSLRIHSHSHTGEKPFVCPHPNCGKAFSVRSNMRRHERGCHGGGG